MPKLSDTQAILLTAAAQRADGNLLPLPGSLRGGAATKIVAALLARGLVEERTVETTANADPALNTLWRNLDDGRGTLLRITPPGRDALGIAADSAALAASEAERPTATTERSTPVESGSEAAPAARSGKTRTGTKQALLVEMLRRPEGATIDEIVATTSWQPHTVRGAFAGALKKRLGLSIVSEKVEGRGRVFRIAG
jgi:hypothetical protein